MEILSINNLDAWYEKDLVINHLNLNIQPRHILGLLGRNGQGKSTLLNTVSGMHSNYNGVIQIIGNGDITNIEVKRQRYYIQDTPLLFEEMSPLSYFAFLHDLYRKTMDAKRLKYLQDIFDFQESSEKRISTLSLGNRQKANIIAGLLLRVPLLLLDEPLNGLDILSVEAFYQELKVYAAEGNAAILSTHIIDILPQICTDIAILNGGVICDCFQIGEETDVRGRFARTCQK